MKNSRSLLFVVILGVASLCGSSPGFSQRFEPPPGEFIGGKIIYPDGGGLYRTAWTSRCVYTAGYDQFGRFPMWNSYYCTPTDLGIVDVLRTKKGNRSCLFVVLSDGSFLNLTLGEKLGSISLSSYEPPRKLIGDALYMLTTQNIFISRDKANMWTVDTAGLGGTPQDIAIDSQQFVYATTLSGLFRENPDANIWTAITTLPAQAIPNKIFIDRRNRIHVGINQSGYRTLYLSLDRGLTWHVDTVGMGYQNFTGFGDDAFGNVYAIAQNPYTNSGDRLYRSSGTRWIRIDAPLIAWNADSLNTFANTGIFSSIGGDSVLLATSIYGVFSSTNQGVTWTESNSGIQAERVHGLILTPSNYFIASTTLGVFRRARGDTVWTKTFPVNGYIAGQRLFRDNSGVIYTLGAFSTKSDIFNNPPRMTMKSTDEGSTWNPDTLGLSAVTSNSSYTFFVDETGTQHLASYGAGLMPSSIYMKLPGQRWAGDTTGYATNHSAPQAFGSDGKGSLWMSLASQTVPRLWRRSITGGVWSSDTIGLAGEFLNSFVVGKNGTLYAGGFSGVWRRSGTNWSKLPPPSDLYTTTPAFSISIDSTGALIAGYQHFDPSYNSIGDGVFATMDDGAHWRNLQHVDTTTFVQLVSYGDTTYGLSYYDGVFVFDAGATDVVSAAVQTAPKFEIYPNPTYGSITIVVSNVRSSTVQIFDMLGNLITTFNGTSTITWDGRDGAGSKVSSGIYIVMVKGLDQQGNPFRASKQIAVER